MLAHKLQAMPQLIPQGELNMAYVNKWRKLATDAKKRGSVKAHLLSPSDELNPTVLYHYKKSGSSGVWFFWDNVNQVVTYLYAYTSISLAQKPRACEALAYLFDTSVRGFTKEVFFDYLLPDQKFVVTDSQYTPDGKRWFEAEYAFAFRSKLKVYALDLTKKEIELTLIDSKTFRELQELYWGEDDLHQQYRFAIEL